MDRQAIAIGYVREPLAGDLPPAEAQEEAIRRHCRKLGLTLSPVPPGGIARDRCAGNSPVHCREGASQLAELLEQTRQPMRLVLAYPAALWRSPGDACRDLRAWTERGHHVVGVERPCLLEEVERAAEWLQWVDQERRTVGSELRRGLVRGRRICRYGYAWDDDGYAYEVASELETLGRILALREKKESYSTVAEILRQEGRTLRGQEWTARAVRHYASELLRDEDWAAAAVRWQAEHSARPST